MNHGSLVRLQASPSIPGPRWRYHWHLAKEPHALFSFIKTHLKQTNYRYNGWKNTHTSHLWYLWNPFTPFCQRFTTVFVFRGALADHRCTMHIRARSSMITAPQWRGPTRLGQLFRWQMVKRDPGLTNTQGPKTTSDIYVPLFFPKTCTFGELVLLFPVVFVVFWSIFSIVLLANCMANKPTCLREKKIITIEVCCFLAVSKPHPGRCKSKHSMKNNEKHIQCNTWHGIDMFFLTIYMSTPATKLGYYPIVDHGSEVDPLMLDPLANECPYPVPDGNGWPLLVFNWQEHSPAVIIYGHSSTPVLRHETPTKPVNVEGYQAGDTWEPFSKYTLFSNNSILFFFKGG